MLALRNTVNAHTLVSQRTATHRLLDCCTQRTCTCIPVSGDICWLLLSVTVTHSCHCHFQCACSGAATGERTTVKRDMHAAHNESATVPQKATGRIGLLESAGSHLTRWATRNKQANKRKTTQRVQFELSPVLFTDTLIQHKLCLFYLFTPLYPVCTRKV